jgi:hypothetical protein
VPAEAEQRPEAPKKARKFKVVDDDDDDEPAATIAVPVAVTESNANGVEVEMVHVEPLKVDERGHEIAEVDDSKCAHQSTEPQIAVNASTISKPKKATSSAKSLSTSPSPSADEPTSDSEADAKSCKKRTNKPKKALRVASGVDDDGDSDDMGQGNEGSEEESEIPKESKLSKAAMAEISKRAGKYDPIASATWKAGDPVPYAFLAEAFERIEATTKRLEITEIICNVFRSIIALSPQDLLPTVCLVTNEVSFKQSELNFI